ncbi:MAG: hypothetical protein CTY38_04825 [Methylotenera sp.]|uniref:TnsD family Tn7-like transposition protein n=1 Tax=Methylotenera sp. TaxID=2051956 RepID=UPI000D4B2382|nr:TnsD family Tn7-like transposition protein [Methylotenera sp.]PPC83161.1 MAG: hypothetical protein CTY38_04825 [Methylotenera sp.]
MGGSNIVHLIVNQWSATALPGFERFGLPQIMDDETLYSWCARYHQLTMHLNGKVTSRLLFGCSNAGLDHEIPFNLKTFEANTRGFLGTAERLLSEYTCFGFYSRFLTEDLRLKFSQYFINSYSSSAKIKLGINHQTSASDRILKYCPKCIETQNQSKRFSWWRLSQQLPTAFVCLEHGERLRFLSLPYSRGYTKAFYTSSLTINTVFIDQDCDGPKTLLNMRKVSAWGEAIYRTNELKLTDHILRWCYSYQASTKGWVGSNGLVNLGELQRAFVFHYGELLGLFGEKYLNDFNNPDSVFYRHLNKKVSGRQHPVKVVLLLNFLFDSFEDFLRVLDDVTTDLLEGGEALCSAIVGKRRYAVAHIKLNAGQSIEEVASFLQISGLPVAKLFDKYSVKRGSLPKVLGTDKELLIKKKLIQGLGYKEVGTSVGVRTSYVKAYLAKHPELRNVWKEAYYLNRVTSHRKQFLAALNAHPGASLNAIKRVPKNGFHWLSNHDKEWLKDALPAIWRADL